MIKKPNESISFNLGDIQLLHIIIFLGASSYLDFGLKTCKTSETKCYFPYECFDDPEKLNITQCPPYKTFSIKLSNNNPFEQEYSKFGGSKDGGMNSKEAFWNLKLNQPPAIRPENYQNLTSVWQQENMCTFKDFCAGLIPTTLLLR